ncbi:HK97 family phage prohead protease [Priestia aryabhattai]|uniref:HK97 family phage prohead protease n=1 Tax=Priestia aryabhattai TaxID=412384 RepID=UPI00234F811D|nr:HK97 family phage prohead protease [Priestia aryabhattai]MDC7762667.1 HK97 family phage prohead protease [Priestia aryabhattai]
MTINKMELRVNELQLNTITEDKMVVSGYVNKTNQWSQPLGTRAKFVERITPGTFKRALQRATEIQFLAEHDSKKILSSTKNGKLTLREDSEGLYMEAEITRTSWGEDYYNLIKDGIITNMSFGMAVRGQEWEKRNDGISERTINELDLFEVSAVKNPAYVQSTIAARSIEVIEDVEIPTEKAEQCELTLQEEIKIKKANLNKLKMVLDVKDPIDIERLKKAESEIRKMEATLEKQKTATPADNLENKEARMMTPVGTFDSDLVKTNLIREKAKKMNGKHSLVGRTNIEIQKEGKLEVVLRDAENYNKNLFVGDSENVDLNDYTGTKVFLETKRIGTATEVSKTLLEKSNRAEQEAEIENISISRIEDSTNRSMLKGEGNMESLNADTSVSTVIETVEANQIALDDIYDLTDSLNQEYREGSVFIMHQNTIRKIRKNKEFTADILKREVDEVTGKKIYHLDGYPVLVNDYANENRIIFGNLYTGYKTLISENLKSVTQDIYGNQINKQYRSFDLQPTSDTNKAIKGTVVYNMDAYMGGKVINKDCFARLDVKQVTQASESDSKQVENPIEETSKETETVEENSTTTQSESAPVIEENPTDNVSNENETATEKSVAIESEEKSESAVVEKTKPQKKKSTKQNKPKI